MKPVCLFILISLLLAEARAQKKITKEPVKKNMDKGTKLLRGPYLQVATPTGITIRWRTDQPEKGMVQYGDSPEHLTQKVSDTKSVRDHVLTLDGLTPAKKYYYAIGGQNGILQGDRDNSFSTLPVPGTEGFYRVGILGDPGSLTKLQRNVRDKFLQYLGKNELNAWVALGDIAYNQGKDAEYQAEFFNVYKDQLLKKYPLFTLPGNHDYADEDKVTFYSHDKINYYNTFSMPVNGESGGLPSHNQAYYSFDVGNIHFLSLDSFGQQDSTKLYDTLGTQVQWIKKDLEANKNKDWVVAMWHHPPYSMGSHNSDEQDELIYVRQNFISILERYGVDVILCGHSHLYERSKLIEKHYGESDSFNPRQHIVNNSSGLYNGTPNSCPYNKDDTATRGTVYIVNGGSSELGAVQKKYPHKAMYYSDAKHGGANIFEVQGNRLDFKWICEDGVIRDQFTMMKNVNRKSVIHAGKGEPVTLTASFVGSYEWDNKQTTKSIRITPPVGRSIYSVRDKYNCITDNFEIVVSN
ncbi:MAG: metallophosphoesterase family protein [Bacteroidota bacterium]